MNKIHIIRVLESNSNGTLRIVIPKQIKESLDINGGDYLAVTYDKDNKIIFKKVENKI